MQCQRVARMKEPGFTLIELLVVVSIIALLVAILLPTLRDARELAKRSICASHLHSVAQSMHLYGNDYGGSLPPCRPEGPAPQTPAVMDQFPLPMKELFDAYSEGVYEIFDCANLEGMFSNEIRKYFDPTQDSYTQYVFGTQNTNQIYMGYAYLGKAKYQASPIVVDTWLNGSKIPSTVYDPGDLPLIVCPAVKWGTWGWPHIGHAEGGAGFSYIRAYHLENITVFTSGYIGEVAGANHAYVDGHVAWVPGDELEPGIGESFQRWKLAPPE